MLPSIVGWLVTDVSGQHTGPIFKCQGIQDELSGTGYHVADPRIRIRECGLDYSGAEVSSDGLL